MKYFFRILVVSFVTILCQAKQYNPVGDVGQRYVTHRQKKKLFKSVGCQYINKMEIDVPGFEKIKPRKTQYYALYKDTIDELSKKYYHQVATHHLAPMYLKWISTTVGHGVFALQDIKKNDFIGVYAGTLRLLRDIHDKNYDKNPENLDYAWYYIINYPQTEQRLIVDGEFIGNELRFINHAQDPNTQLVSVLFDDKFYICYVACKDIDRDDQITVHYGPYYWSGRGVDPALFE